MRITQTTNGLRVHAIAGTYVVLLGFDLPVADCAGLLGFSIHRQDLTENEAYYLSGSKAFAETDPGFPAGTQYSTHDHPIQSFQWADYSVKPGHHYIYTITARKGTPSNLTDFATTIIDIHTEAVTANEHNVYFNRGVSGSQAYVRRFGDLSPDAVPNRKAYEWLSRGLNEALEDFIRSCVPGVDSLRIAAYEFNYERFLDVIKEALAAGVDVKFVFDARQDNPKLKNIATLQALGLELPNVSFQRTQPKSYISHNKFIVKLHNGTPHSVWTGGTNFSEGGIYGHSNVAHVVEDPLIAQQFLDYWNDLAGDPTSTSLKNNIETLTPLPIGQLPQGTTAIFSPRKNLDALNWYAELARNATGSLFITFAFGLPDVFKDVYANAQAPLRFALLEQKTRSIKAGPEKQAEEGKIQQLRNKPENVFAVGNFIRTSTVDGWLKERLSGLNSHVRYVHNKFMLIDALGDDPIVISGSANFSEASTIRNDENMLVIRGNTRVADIYLGEFMRLYSHFAFRESLQWRKPDDPPKPLRTDDWWQDYFGNTTRSHRRMCFARSQAMALSTSGEVEE
ncbi:MAG: phospholipase D-like domain-containing protein [Anaerolineaceae bacterium]|nr:phospholipase D-like domain-containing protein [Anaerolineaceae bacterium]